MPDEAAEISKSMETIIDRHRASYWFKIGAIVGGVVLGTHGLSYVAFLRPAADKAAQADTTAMIGALWSKASADRAQEWRKVQDQRWDSVFRILKHKK